MSLVMFAYKAHMKNAMIIFFAAESFFLGILFTLSIFPRKNHGQ